MQKDLALNGKNSLFLERADKFHGAFPHWWDGETGKIKPFSPKDDGGDLVETAFLVQGLLAAHQYYANGNKEERELAARMDKLWRDVDWNWYRNKENVLFWHWSPEHQWDMNFRVRGFNECLIMYILAAASPTHGVRQRFTTKAGRKAAQSLSRIQPRTCR